jgi:hypothetical protein
VERFTQRAFTLRGKGPNALRIGGWRLEAGGWRLGEPQCRLDNIKKNKKQTPWPLVRERTIPTERPPLVDEILVSTFVERGVSRGQRGGSPYGR